jgi:hypothetical protein
MFKHFLRTATRALLGVTWYCHDSITVHPYQQNLLNCANIFIFNFIVYYLFIHKEQNVNS